MLTFGPGAGAGTGAGTATPPPPPAAAAGASAPTSALPDTTEEDTASAAGGREAPGGENSGGDTGAIKTAAATEPEPAVPSQQEQQQGAQARREGGSSSSSSSYVGCKSTTSEGKDERDGDAEVLQYEVRVTSDAWMVAGRKKGSLRLPLPEGSRTIVSLHCLPLRAGFLPPPTLHFPGLDEHCVGQAAVGAHLLRVLPQEPCSAFCATKHVTGGG